MSSNNGERDRKYFGRNDHDDYTKLLLHTVVAEP